ncbi:hypothetical protein [Mycobacterium sp. M26]|uniref:hypothetical protein n=1 Tax=Mycobacterium sp. M26 TaxID=1762962 RepID=UPI000ACE9616|nr:hypothetical protein [Mycobacterium sp. M26]
MAVRRSLSVLLVGVVAGLASAVAIAGAAAASADGLTTQTGGSVDYDGTQGSFDNDGTSGTSRNLTTSSTGGHAIVSDACFVKQNPHYCPPPASFDPSYISSVSGASDQVGSALDSDGYQADHAFGPNITAVPGSKATPPKGFYH